MCGIGGFFVSPNSTLLKEGGLIKLRELAVETLKNLQPNGREAAGIAIVKDDGIRVFKQPVIASKMIEMPEFTSFIVQNIDSKTISVLIHTRLPTCGDKENNNNNHPVIHGDVVGIHNGHVNNHKDIFEKLKVKRVGEVDSEAIFALLNLAWAHEIKTTTHVRDIDYTDAVVKSVSVLSGQYAFAAVNARVPTRLALVRSGQPCAVVKRLWKEDERMITFATNVRATEEAGKVAKIWESVPCKDYDFAPDKAMLHIRLDHKGDIEIGERKIGG